MKINRLFVVGLLYVALLAAGCGKEISTEEFEVDGSANVAESSEINDGIGNQETIGTVSHGVNWAGEEEYSLVYNGGQLEIPYGMNGSGICTSVGFLIYMDGIPQPYMIKDTEEEYRYMHVIEGEENTDTEFVICFIPVTGKTGDKVSLSINSIANPSFVPDMESTFEYGMSHQSLEAVYDVTFNQDTENMPEVTDDLYIMSKVSNKQTDIDKEEKTQIQDKSLESELDLDTGVYSDLIIDDESMLLDSKRNIADKDIVHISYVMMGHPGVKYRVSFYLNHQLLTDASKDVYEIELATGKMNAIEFDLDLSEFIDGTFYVVAVPINAADYPEDGIGTIKYQSIHLYRESMEKAQTTRKMEEKTEVDITGLEETLSKFENVTNMAYVSREKLFVVADKMYLIDILTGEIVASNSECDYAAGDIKVYSDDTNIIIVGKKGVDAGEEDIVFWGDDDEDAPKQCILYYDNQLELVEQINIYETFGLDPDLAEDVAVSKNGDIAVYDEENRELYLCNTDRGEKKKILGEKGTELIYDNKVQFVISGGIEFVQDGGKIVFKAECLDAPVENGATDYCGIGSVMLDGSELTVHKVGNEYSEMGAFSKFSILSQDCGFTAPTGEAVKYLYTTDSLEKMELDSEAESENLYCSDNGSTMVTFEKSDDDVWKIRFYKTEDGKLFAKEICESLSEEKYREPKIYMFEESKLAILHFGSLNDTRKDEFRVIQI